MEAEYIAISEACREVSCLRKLLQDFNEQQEEPTTMLEDNNSCMDFIVNDHSSRRSKHIDTRIHFAKDLSEKAIVAVEYCPSASMIADILTKPLGRQKQQQFSEMLGLTKSDGR